MIVTTDYVYLNPDMYETKDIIEKTRVENERKIGNNCEEYKVKFNVNFLDKLKNKTKNISTKIIRKSIIAPQNRYELIEINKIKIIIRRKFCKKKVINTYKKCGNNPILLEKNFLEYCKKKDYVNNYCKRSINCFDGHCREWHLHKLMRKHYDNF